MLLTGVAGDRDEVAGRLDAALARRTAASIGAATLGPDGSDFDSLYAHADADLYAQKEKRRSAVPEPLAVGSPTVGLTAC